METAFFCYTVAMLIVFSAAGMISLSSYFVTQKRSYLFLTGFFLFYALDLSLIFQYEYFGLNMPMTNSEFYRIESAWLKTLLSLGALQSLWMLACDLLDEKRLSLLALPAIGFLLVQALTLFLVPEGPWQQWAYYSERQLAMLAGILYVLRRSSKDESRYLRILTKRHKATIVLVICLLVLVVVEDTVNILLLDPPLAGSSFPLYLSERNFTENALSLVLAFITFRASARLLKLRFNEPPHTDTPKVEQHVDDNLSPYAARFALTQREKEILRLVLLGKSNQSIANDLQLALGTVKTHVHNILKKTGQESRQSLLQDFWKS